MVGLIWTKLDLHVHTPASKCFIDKDTSGKPVNPEMIVQMALKKGLRGIAVTDHMSGDWVDVIKKAAVGTGLIVFPGVELSVAQCHIVAIFDQSCATRDIVLLLGDLGVKNEDYGSTQNPITKGFEEVLSTIKSRAGLVVLAHIDCPYSGAWAAISKTSPKQQLFNNPDYDAIEVQAARPPQELLDVVFGKQHGYARIPAYYHASDNPCQSDPKKHSLEGIGSKFSYFKVESNCTLEDLRQCFIDPHQRIRLPGTFSELSSAKIVSLTVTGGFLNRAKFDFHPNLTTVVGGKGVGKSLIVEFLRLGLQNLSTIPVIAYDHQSKIVDQLGRNAIIEVMCVSKSGDAYIARTTITNTQMRTSSKPATYDVHRVQINVTTGEEINADFSKLMPVKAYSQSEIIEISRMKTEQMILIDSFIDLNDVNVEIEQSRIDIENAIEKMLDSRTAALQLIKLETERSTLVVSLKEVLGQLKNEIFTKHKMHEDADRLVVAASERWTEIDNIIAKFRTTLEDWEPVEKPINELVGDLIGEIGTLQIIVKKEIQKAIDSAINATSKVREGTNGKLGLWQAQFTAVKEEYEKIKVAIGGSYEMLDRKRKILEAQIEEKTKMLTAANEKTRNFGAARKEADIARGLLHAALDKKHALRQSKVEALSAMSGGTLRMKVVKGEGRAKTQEALRNAKSGLRDTTLAELVNVLPSYDLSLLLVEPENPPDTFLPIELEQWLTLKEKVLGLDNRKNYIQLLARTLPEDIPVIELRKHGSDYGALEDLSQGQKCTALMILTLLDGDEPVIIDQPEDSLDIRAVWKDIVSTIRSRKGHRQFIFTTHNSSIAVAGDSDCIMILEPSGRSVRKACEGSIDVENVKNGVIEHLEGGLAPYYLRSKKYNLKGT